MMDVVILVYGPPACGKTTISTQIYHHFSETQVTCEIIHFDDFSPNGTFSSDAWTMGRNRALKCFHDLIFSCSKSRPSVVILDDNMQYKSMRKKIKREADRSNYKLIQIRCLCTIDTAFKRNATRLNATHVSHETIRKMFSILARDNEKEKNAIEVNTENGKMDQLISDLLTQIQQACSTSEPPLEEKNDLQNVPYILPNLSHSADLESRRMMNQFIKQHIDKIPLEIRSRLTKLLNQRRKSLILRFSQNPTQLQFDLKQYLDTISHEFDNCLNDCIALNPN